MSALASQARRPMVRISSTVASAVRRLRKKLTTMSAPRLAKCKARARPIPRPDPVIKTCLSWKKFEVAHASIIQELFDENLDMISVFFVHDINDLAFQVAIVKHLAQLAEIYISNFRCVFCPDT